MVLAIEADGASYRDSRSARDRDRLRKEHLERLGWTFHRIWSTNWFSDPEAEVAKVQEAYREAVGKIGTAPASRPPGPPVHPPAPRPPGPARPPPVLPPPAARPSRARPSRSGSPPRQSRPRHFPLKPQIYGEML